MSIKLEDEYSKEAKASATTTSTTAAIVADSEIIAAADATGSSSTTDGTVASLSKNSAECINIDSEIDENNNKKKSNSSKVTENILIDHSSSLEAKDKHSSSLFKSINKQIAQHGHSKNKQNRLVLDNEQSKETSTTIVSARDQESNKLTKEISNKPMRKEHSKESLNQKTTLNINNTTSQLKQRILSGGVDTGSVKRYNNSFHFNQQRGGRIAPVGLNSSNMKASYYSGTMSGFVSAPSFVYNMAPNGSIYQQPHHDYIKRNIGSGQFITNSNFNLNSNLASNYFLSQNDSAFRSNNFSSRPHHYYSESASKIKPIKVN
jgi:hypothetical protein